MLSEHQNLIAALRYNIQQLKSKYESEKREHELALAELNQVSHELTMARGNFSQLQQKYANLKRAENSLLTEDERKLIEEERKNANRRLQRMMREIDKCIALLND